MDPMRVCRRRLNVDRLHRDRYIAYVGARVDAAALDALRQHAADRQDSVSELVRLAITRYLEAEGISVPQTVWRDQQGCHGWQESGLFP